MSETAHARPFTGESEGDPLGVPTGLLMWGQAGIYNAVDDRLVIAGVTDSMIGVVRPATLTPGPGLQVNIGPGWLAVADCGDGTTAIAGSRQSHALDESAGPSSGSRIDHVWVDTFPNDGAWELRLVPEGQTIGRAGVSLGRITVPAGANLASQMTFSRLVPTIGRHADATGTPQPGISGTGFQNLSVDYPIAPTSVRPHRTFRVQAYGEGRQGATPADIRFRTTISNSPILRISPTGWLAARENFDWVCECQLQIRAEADRVRHRIVATVTRWSNTDPQQGNTGPTRSVTAVRTRWGEELNLNVGWQNIQVRGAWGSAQAGQWIRSMGSTYDTFEPYS